MSLLTRLVVTQDDSKQVLGKLRRDLVVVTEQVLEPVTAAMLRDMTGAAPRKTGRLAGSLRRIVGTKNAQTYGIVGTSDPQAFYGRFHEFGTRFLSARPWVHPALQANTRSLQARITGALDR